MKLIIAGSRHLHIGTDIFDGLFNSFKLKPNETLCGEANGVDISGKFYSWGKKIIVKHFPADWKKYGKSAGPIRNKQMALYADALLLIWDGESRGSANMKSEMLKLNKPVYEVILKIYNETNNRLITEEISNEELLSLGVCPCGSETPTGCSVTGCPLYCKELLK